jgi:uncharacterized protein (TIGR01777 family)
MTPGNRIIIAGGSGFLGISLAQHLSAAGAEVTILSRRAPAPGPWRTSRGMPARSPTGRPSSTAPPVWSTSSAARSDCIKTPDHCDEILRSRIEATTVLGKACRAVASPPPVWVQMSTAHIYGDPPAARCDEDSPFGYGLAPTVGRAWEDAFARSVLPNQRPVILRTSFVIGRANSGGAGALSKLGLLARLGLGGRVGSGTQGMSWLHERDMNRIFERALTDPAMNGAYIATAPNPVPQQDFMRELRRHAGGLGSVGIGLPAFEWMVRLGAPLLMRTDPELALYGRFVLPRRLLDEGFEFQYPVLGPALADLYLQQ